MCEAAFNTKSDLKRHKIEVQEREGVQVHSNYSFDCSHCEATFNSKPEFKRHEKEVHDKEEGQVQKLDGGQASASNKDMAYHGTDNPFHLINDR